ncbi:RagB/SusD family nutrient uptake outer membrane protein [Gelidibacter sp. F63206]|uniref:RagB/SusD family nutrient uptake outer membrane protein n=1 Tax=Gelidibacter sp. F63206 TaxID=2926425 RepID=UPI001FF67CD1|nr:RagB/SusD family nutrient uptake outer membrane protein [Gelidibacter sp. F63206]
MKFLIVMSLIFISCDDFLEVDPNSSQLDAVLIFENDNTALAALEALYYELENNGFASGNTSSVSYLGNILADDAQEYNNANERVNFYRNDIPADSDHNFYLWSSAYKFIYEVNSLLKGILNNDDLSERTKERIESEAKFIRAFIYYYLTHLYGNVPLVLTTDYSTNKSLARNSMEEIYTQIKQDLNDAITYLPENFSYSHGERIKPTKYAAYTLLARIALWEGQYDWAIESASQVIESENFMLTDLDKVFKANSAEAIWQLVPTNPYNGGKEGYHYIVENNPSTAGTSASSALTEDFLSIWQNNDLRLSNWINVYSEGTDTYYYPFKYKIKNGGDTEEYSMVMRLAELYLIRAEAYAMMGNVDQTLADLNMIRNRAGLQNWEMSDITDIKQMVLEERRREFFSEWGHRWLDLKRFGKIDMVLREKKPQWSPHAKLLPIPKRDLLRNPLLTQNPGY